MSAVASARVARRTAGAAQGLILAAQSVLPTMGALLLVPAIPALLREFRSVPHVEYWVPILLTAPGLCIGLFSFPAGVLGDRYGRRRILIGALALYGFAGLAPLAIPGLAGLLASRVVLGACEAVTATLSVALIGDNFDGVARRRWLSLIGVIASISAVLFLALAGAVGGALGWRGPLAIYAVSFAFVPAMLYATWEPDRPPRRAASPVFAAPSGRTSLLAGTAFVGGLLFYSFAVQQGLLLAALGEADPRRLGELTALASLATPAGGIVFGVLARVRVAALLASAFAILAVAFLAIGWVHTPAAAACAVAVGLFGAGLLLPTLIAWSLDGLAPDHLGKGAGVLQAAFAFGQFASGLVIPWLAEHGGGVPAAFRLLALPATVAALSATTVLYRGASPQLTRGRS